MSSPCCSITSCTARPAVVSGATGTQIVTPPFLVISLAAKPTCRTLRLRCMGEKPRSLDRFWRNGALKQRDRALPALDELRIQNARRHGLARTRKAGEEQGKLLASA